MNSCVVHSWNYHAYILCAIMLFAGEEIRIKRNCVREIGTNFRVGLGRICAGGHLVWLFFLLRNCLVNIIIMSP